MHEADVELAAFDWWQSLGYALRTGSDIDDAGERADASRCLLIGRHGAALHRLNPDLPPPECEQVIRTLSRPPHPTLLENNRWFHAQLVDGVEIEYKDRATGATLKQAALSTENGAD